MYIVWRKHYTNQVIVIHKWVIGQILWHDIFLWKDVLQSLSLSLCYNFINLLIIEHMKIWSVVSNPLKNIKVSWYYYSQYMGNNPHVPVTTKQFVFFSTNPIDFSSERRDLLSHQVCDWIHLATGSHWTPKPCPLSVIIKEWRAIKDWLAMNSDLINGD